MTFENPRFGNADGRVNNPEPEPAFPGSPAGPPRTVPGYREAVEAGIVRVPSVEPPTLLPGLSATWRRSIMTFVPPAVYVVLAVSPMPRPLLFGLVLVGGLCLPLANRWWERRVWDELAAGYMTVPTGRAYKSPPSWHRTWRPWNDAGIWTFDRGGTERSRPDLSVDAPGFYPSPYEPGRLQLWNGYEWIERYRDVGSGLDRRPVD